MSTEGVRGQDLRMQAPPTRQQDHDDHLIAVGAGVWRNEYLLICVAEALAN